MAEDKIGGVKVELKRTGNILDAILGLSANLIRAAASHDKKAVKHAFIGTVASMYVMVNDLCDSEAERDIVEAAIEAGIRKIFEARELLENALKEQQQEAANEAIVGTVDITTHPMH